MIDKIYLNGIKTYSFENRKDFLRYIQEKQEILVALNAEKIMKEDQRLKKLINKNLGYPDGIGVVMALNRKGFNAIKIPGSELWLDIIREFQHKKTFYFIGSTSEVIEKTIYNLKKEFPDLQIVGYRDGFLNEEDKKVLINELKDKKPNIVFVAQGSPRQEFLMEDLKKEFPALYMGLGGSFDIYSGFKKRAPKFFLRFNLEWLYRLVKEPTRIGRQSILIKYFVLLVMNKL